MTWCPGCEHARSKFDCCHGCGLVFGTVQSSLVCVLAFVFKVTCRHATRLIVCHVVSRCVVVPGRNTPAPSVQFEFSQFCGVVCAGHDRCALAIKLRQTSAHTHVPTGFAVRSGTSDVRIARHWTTVWPFQVMVVGARVVAMFFPLVLGVRCRSDCSNQPHPSTCVLVDVKSVELVWSKYCDVAAGAVLSCGAWCFCCADVCVLIHSEFHRMRLPRIVVLLGVWRCLFG